MRDYVSCIVLRASVFFLRFLPLRLWLFFARGAGWAYYYFAGKKNRKAYANLKLAFPDKPRSQLKRIIKKMYQRLAQNLTETLYLPFIDERFIKRYVKITGLCEVEKALAQGKGVIYLACHTGSWELSNAACATLFSAAGGSASGGEKSRHAMLVQPQAKHKRLDCFLNSLRESKGFHVIRVDELRKIVEYLSNNNTLGIVADHGGREGVPIEFFGKLAMTPVGSVKLAKKIGSKIILAFMHRLDGPFHEMIFKPYELVLTGDAAEDIQVNLTQINKIFEKWITQYPEEYLWLYKRWKYSPQRNVLILSDGKAGHLKQSLALADMISALGFKVKKDVIEAKWRAKGINKLLSFAGYLLGPRFVLFCLPFFLEKEAYRAIMGSAYDIVISAGSSLAVLNQALAFENNAKAIAIMKPGIFKWDDFDAVILPEHDRPPMRENILVSAGSLNNVTPESIKSDYEALCLLRPALKEGRDMAQKPGIGVLIGGDSKNYQLLPEAVTLLCEQLKKILEEAGGSLFLTTSRRTPDAVVSVLKSYFGDDPRCKLFVVASQDNPCGTVGGILYLSDYVIVSGESISMVSEAVSSGKYILVFEPRSRLKDNKVRRYLNFLAKEKYVYLLNVNEIYDKLSGIIRERPAQPFLDTRTPILEGLKKLL